MDQRRWSNLSLRGPWLVCGAAPKMPLFSAQIRLGSSAGKTCHGSAPWLSRTSRRSGSRLGSALYRPRNRRRVGGSSARSSDLWRSRLMPRFSPTGCRQQGLASLTALPHVLAGIAFRACLFGSRGFVCDGQSLSASRPEAGRWYGARGGAGRRAAGSDTAAQVVWASLPHGRTPGPFFGATPRHTTGFADDAVHEAACRHASQTWSACCHTRMRQRPDIAVGAGYAGPDAPGADRCRCPNAGRTVPETAGAAEAGHRPELP